MFKPFSLYVGLRYTAAKRNNNFISFISLVSMLGLMLGVAALIVVLSVMNGFDRELRERILGMVPHATITAYEKPISDWRALAKQAAKDPRVIATAPFIRAEGMLTNAGRVKPAFVQGIDPEAEANASIVTKHIKSGDWQQLQAGKYNIFLGKNLASNLGLRLGDKVTLVLPEASVSIAGVIPRLKRFTFVGTFEVGAELDSSLAYIHIADAARIKRMQGVEGIRLTLDDLFEARSTVRDIAAQLNGYFYISDWTRTQGNLFAAIQMEKRMVGLLLFLIVFVAAFNIVSTLVMVVTDKKSDIAILRTLGASRGLIMRIFMVQGAVIGILGTLMGTLLGIALALTISDLVEYFEQLFGFEVLSADVYFISYLPSEINWSDVSTIVIVALLISFLATLYPAYKASRTEPAEALRYE
ncbi:MAG: lipoprotein-releasing ABC transporter permease subunit [Pseudomonadales bacterium]|nr:lipoprotein-releasing ABC transporter permease subunit [Pseudomonadales bacterium]NRA14000.1 lipoprotein-releasing ABC transporter permease subunit [Oceanospirillaceae bacterium]